MSFWCRWAIARLSKSALNSSSSNESIAASKSAFFAYVFGRLISPRHYHWSIKILRGLILVFSVYCGILALVGVVTAPFIYQGTYVSVPLVVFACLAVVGVASLVIWDLCKTYKRG
jgi:hypothetical protein